jgi:hypothetical protein
MTAAKNTSPPKTVPAIAPMGVPELLLVVSEAAAEVTVVVAEIVGEAEDGAAVDDGDESSMHD